MIAAGHPVIFVAAGEEGPTIAADNAAGIREAVQHFIEHSTHNTHGHRRIAFIAFIAGSPEDMAGDTGARLRAYRLALDEFGLTGDERLVAYGRHIFSGGHAAMQQILATGAPFTAVLASNDESALGAMQALADVPETKVSVLVSKPPQPAVLKKVYSLIRKTKKPVVALFLGEGGMPATLEQAAHLAETFCAGNEHALAGTQLGCRPRFHDAPDRLVTRNERVSPSWKGRHPSRPQQSLGAGADAAPVDIDDHVVRGWRGQGKPGELDLLRLRQHDGDGFHRSLRSRDERT